MRIKLWPHQERVFDLLAEGQSVILQAPTGSGKTRAALYPFLEAQDYQSPRHNSFPHKCIYSVPMRVLAKQFVREYKRAVEPYNREYGLDISVAIQTGDRPDDRLLASNLVFATIDQTLSSFLLSPYSLPHSQANLNAGAVLSAYLVFDEFHLYDPVSTLPTTLHMLQMLSGMVPFVLMTATFSGPMLEALAEELGAVIVPGSAEELEQLQALPPQRKTRRYHVVEDAPLSAHHVLEQHQGRSLVICNTVDRARWMYQQLREATHGTDTRVLLLHSRFLREDRDRIEAEIHAYFGKNGRQEGSLIVVSTQAIEVGVDITSTALHTELAPANAIVQRAGRCARYEGDEGDVFIYRYAYSPGDGETLDLLENVMPYKKQEDEFSCTLQEFRARDGAVLNYREELNVISEVHGPRDRAIIKELRATESRYRRRMFAVMRGDEGENARNLIRDIQQQQIIIHAQPDALLAAPFNVPSFGLHPGTAQKYIKHWLERADELDLDTPIYYLQRVKDKDAYNDLVQANQSPYVWEPLCTPQSAWGSSLVVVHPDLATYDPEQGFLPEQGGAWQAQPPAPKQRDTNGYTYRLETYEQHIELVHEAAFAGEESFWREMVWAAERLEQRYGWPKGSVHHAAELAVLLHDVGKLNTKWQRWVRDYQKRIGRATQADQAYAHTDLFTAEHRAVERQMPRRPWHAVEGALAVLPTLAQAFGPEHPLTDAAFSAIARHHAPTSEMNRAFRLLADAVRHVRVPQLADVPLELLGVEEPMPADAGARDIIAQPERDLSAFWAYVLIVRVLRRADQEGTRLGTLQIM